MAALLPIQLQDLGKTFQNLVRDMDIATLFEPGIPGNAHTSQLSKLLSSQSGCSSVVECRQIKLLWTQTSTTCFQKIGQICAALQCMSHAFLFALSSMLAMTTATPMISTLLDQTEM
jgi:hypothetical protein